MRLFLFCAVALLPIASFSLAPKQNTTSTSAVDSDRDGLSDALEQSLLLQFAPSFMVGKSDCSNLPAEFKPDSITPAVIAEDGTIYGQVFPAKGYTESNPVVEIHFYHLWRRDCGPHGHALDTEHVSTLVHRKGSDNNGRWEAAFWYAAAHENTVCDVSQITRASTIDAKDHGATVWVSPGKHASYLNAALCQRGCGADRCQQMKALSTNKLINLGEPGHPMNGSSFIASTRWPLAEKMASSNFPGSAIARLDLLPKTDIAWFNPGQHPAQGVIAVSSATAESIATSGRNTSNAISTAGDSTNVALSITEDSTSNALQKTYHKTTHALGVSARHVGDALHLTPQDDPPK